jgi:hypothetical protein
MKSYYVREIEFETAFARMVRDRRDTFILPIMIQRLHDVLPSRLAGRHYLDFTRRGRYTENLRMLAKRIRTGSDAFTGHRWYKALEVSPFGEIMGVGEITQKAPTGSCVCIIWNKGRVERADLYVNEQQCNYKLFEFDQQERVVENKMYEPDGSGGWRYVDTWRYEYDSISGRRTKKFIERPGALSYRVLSYDGHNHVVEERVVSVDGARDPAFGYARKVFEYADGHVVRENHFDDAGKLIKTINRDRKRD